MSDKLILQKINKKFYYASTNHYSNNEGKKTLAMI